ncbi:hypothetical protein B0H11DRAFT_690406 [Mycena galericulata]|nr:hypothetical protein B0H11DRAFT_690406 [Mycena galericulata]
MQLHPGALALALPLFSLAAGQPEDPRSTTSFDTAAPSPSDVPVATATILPRPPFGPFPTVFTVSTTTSLTFATAVPDPDPESHNKTLPAGAIIAAAVGGSVAACLIVVTSTLFFCFRFHRARARPSVTAPPDADTARILRLENELRVLRARVERVEVLLAASPRTGAGGGGGVMYVNEKDDSTLAEGPGADLTLPKYVD